jgi:hypothetical protein
MAAAGADEDSIMFVMMGVGKLSRGGEAGGGRKRGERFVTDMTHFGLLSTSAAPCIAPPCFGAVEGAVGGAGGGSSSGGGGGDASGAALEAASFPQVGDRVIAQRKKGRRSTESVAGTITAVCSDEHPARCTVECDDAVTVKRVLVSDVATSPETRALDSQLEPWTQQQRAVYPLLFQHGDFIFNWEQWHGVERTYLNLKEVADTQANPGSEMWPKWLTADDRTTCMRQPSILLQHFVINTVRDENGTNVHQADATYEALQCVSVPAIAELKEQLGAVDNVDRFKNWLDALRRADIEACAAVMDAGRVRLAVIQAPGGGE